MTTSRLSTLRRPLGLVLALTFALQGCGSTDVREHRTRGAPESITFKPTWRDAQGEHHLVGGIHCEVRRGGQVVLSGRTDGKTPLLLEPLEPGTYDVLVSAPGLAAAQREVELKPRRRLTVRMDIEATALEEKPAPTSSSEPRTRGPSTGEKVGEGIVFVLKAVGTVLLVVTLIGLVAVVLAVDDDSCD